VAGAAKRGVINGLEGSACGSRGISAPRPDRRVVDRCAVGSRPKARAQRRVRRTNRHALPALREQIGRFRDKELKGGTIVRCPHCGGNVEALGPRSLIPTIRGARARPLGRVA
jgi:hypothetical protein